MKTSTIFISYFDHSSGHDRLQPDGLNVNEMNKLFGGSQSNLCDSKMKNKTYLGPFDHPTKLKLGDVQKSTFQADDSGPFWMSDEERINNKCVCELDTNETKKYTKNQLIDLIWIGTNLVDIKGNLLEIQKIAQKSNIPIEYTRKK